MTAALAGVVVAGLSLAYGAYEGESGRAERSRARRRQGQAQARAERQAEGQQRRAEIEERRENQRLPDLASLLTEEGNGGSLASLLSGPGGIDPSRLTLGRRSLLGG